MKFLVIQTPTYEVPIEQVPGMLAAERDWYDRNREYLDAYGWFVEGGGFGIADVPDAETLSRVNSEHPFERASTTQIHVIVDADVAVRQVRELLEQQGIAVPA